LRSNTWTVLFQTGFPLAILDEFTIEWPPGWVFFYDVDRTGGQYVDMQLAGNGPLIVSRLDGSVHDCGSAQAVEFYMENFEKYGSAYPPARE
jgi:hypothetical protein